MVLATNQIVVRLHGGLGNQMFQYATAFALSKRDSRDLIVDTRWLNRKTLDPLFVKREYGLGIFNVRGEKLGSNKRRFPFRHAFGPSILGQVETKIARCFTHFGLSNIYVEPAFTYREIPSFRLDKPVYLSGYFQSPKYFDEFETELREEFSFSQTLSFSEQEMQSRIEGSPSLCINVRRGDFVHNAKNAQFHGALDASYFDRALIQSRRHVGDLPIFIFSDDIQWCERNLSHLGDVTFVSHEFAGKHFGAYLRLMSSCTAFIIPNSTFAWWAVWLSAAECPSVIAPKRWFLNDTPDTSDLIPQNWVRV
jgi:hypothetical protein